MSRLCDQVKIRYPIIQSGMGRVAGADLVAEVSRAGGLGVLAALNLTPDDVRLQIRRIRQLTDRPFGVNLWLHPDLMPRESRPALTGRRRRHERCIEPSTAVGGPSRNKTVTSTTARSDRGHHRRHPRRANPGLEHCSWASAVRCRRALQAERRSDHGDGD